jgi:hypothetical protein
MSLDDGNVTVSDLAPATLERVAQRLGGPNGFGDLIYRESEVDALWSLADNAVTVRATSGDLAGVSEADLLRFRALLAEAHGLIGGGKCDEAAARVLEAARLRSSWA